MNYCRPCATFRRWPFEGYMFKSRGTCEVCERPGRECVDVPARNLSAPFSPADGPDVCTEAEHIERIREQAAEGDPIAVDLLHEWDIPLSGWHPFGSAEPRAAMTSVAPPQED